MKIRSLLVVAALVGLATGLGAPPAQAATHKGRVVMPQAPGWFGVLVYYAAAGPDTVTGRAFLAACAADRAAIARGQKPQAIERMIASPTNGLDGFVIDLKKETMGAFAVKGPGAKELVPDNPATSPVTSYDLDLDFFTDPSVDPTSTTGRSGCNDANEKAAGNYNHKCYAHKPLPDEKTSCISGFKDSKGKLRGARYVVVSAGLNLVGPMDITLTTP